ncbi:MAG: hypothetical protein LBC46_02200 [Treponema sp.]|jgi:acetyltransferase-like isoleucine patch superfamily enzyme|nr:hypothetical protein [Treponema sp.]
MEKRLRLARQTFRKTGAVIGAGSVVPKDIPAGVIAVDDPCKALHPIGPEDRVYYYKERKFSNL